MSLKEIESCMTPWEIKFVEEYEKASSLAAAVKNAGFEKEDNISASKYGSQTIRKPKIAAYIDKKLNEEIKNLKVTPEMVIAKTDQLYWLCMQAKSHRSYNFAANKTEYEVIWTCDYNNALHALRLMFKILGVFNNKMDKKQSFEEFLSSLNSTNDGDENSGGCYEPESKYETEPDYSSVIKKAERRLTPRELKFVKHYEITGDTKTSVLYAGYSLKNNHNAWHFGYNLLQKPKIIAYRQARQIELYKNIGITNEDMIIRANEILQRSMQKIPHMTWNQEKREFEPDGKWRYNAGIALRTLRLLRDILGLRNNKKRKNDHELEYEDFIKPCGEMEY
jgi:phage terminase small subunit